MDSSPLPGRDRLLVAQSVSVLMLSILAGALLTFQSGYGLGKFGGHEYIPRVTTLAIVRDDASAISASALFLALVVWSHELGPGAVRSGLEKAMAQVLLLAVPSVAVATVLATVTSLAIARLGYAVPSSAIRAGIAILELDDFIRQCKIFALEQALVSAVCWLSIPWLSGTRWSLIAKIAAGWLGLALLRLALSTLAGVFDV